MLFVSPALQVSGSPVHIGRVGRTGEQGEARFAVSQAVNVDALGIHLVERHFHDAAGWAAWFLFSQKFSGEFRRRNGLDGREFVILHVARHDEVGLKLFRADALQRVFKIGKTRTDRRQRQFRVAAHNFHERKQVFKKFQGCPPVFRHIIGVGQRVPRNRAVDFSRFAAIQHAGGTGQEFFASGHHVQQHVAIQQDFHENFLASCIPRRSDFFGERNATLPFQRSENGLSLRT